MAKFFKWSTIIFIVYVIGISWYLYYGSGSGIPAEYQGTAADPQMFMNERQIELSYEYSRIKHILFFIITPFEWLMLLGLLIFGFSKRFQSWAENITKSSILQKAIYIFWFTFTTSLIMFPIQWLSYQVSKSYGIAASNFQTWFKDQLIDFWIGYITMAIIVTVVYWLMKKSTKKWWLYAWLLSIPFTFFIMFIQPVVIDPLYNDFYPLKDKQLEEQILNYASKANIPAQHVYEVNMSKKTNALNAYVTGIGDNSRIVLWDTTLKKLTDDEVLFVMAHEMGHYVMKHIYIGISGYLILSLFGLFLTAKLMDYIVNRWGNKLRINSIHSISSLPLLLLIFSVMSFAVSPASNAFSRHQEHASDQYAIEMTQDPESAVSAFQKLTVVGLSEVHPPAIVKWFRYGHPTMLERIHFLNNYKTEE